MMNIYLNTVIIVYFYCQRLIKFYSLETKIFVKKMEKKVLRLLKFNIKDYTEFIDLKIFWNLYRPYQILIESIYFCYPCFVLVYILETN